MPVIHTLLIFKLYKLALSCFAVSTTAVVLLPRQSNEGKKRTENAGNWKLMFMLWNPVEPAGLYLYRMS